jgi:hypothetical protein
MEALKSGPESDDDRLIVRSSFVGPQYQYSRGFSVYFPWSEPAGDFFRDQYKEYRFRSTHWNEFLASYFKATRRQPRTAEKDFRESERDDGAYRTQRDQPASQQERIPRWREQKKIEEDLMILLQSVSAKAYNRDGRLASAQGGALGEGVALKGGSRDPTGDECDCPSIKNHPFITRLPEDRFPLSPTVAAQFEEVE